MSFSKNTWAALGLAVCFGCSDPPESTFEETEALEHDDDEHDDDEHDDDEHDDDEYDDDEHDDDEHDDDEHDDDEHDDDEHQETEPSEPEPSPSFPELCGAVLEEAFRLPHWELEIEQGAWDRLHADVWARLGVEARICVQGVAYPISIELQGASSRKHDKKSFDLKFKKRQPLPGSPFDDGDVDEPFRRVILKAMHLDHSMIREALSFELWRQMGYEAPRTAFVNLRINGEYWGVYQVVEPVNATYLRRHGYAEGGRLYKGVRKHGSFADFAPGRVLRDAFEYHGPADDPLDDPEAYVDLEELVERLQNTPTEPVAFEREIDAIFPLDQYLDRMIWVSYTQNGDAVAQNFFLYATPREGQPLWQLIPWDSNIAFGAKWDDPNEFLSPTGNLYLDGGNYFSRRLLQVEGMMARFAARYLDALEGALALERVSPIFTSFFDHVGSDLEAEHERWGRQPAPWVLRALILDFIERRTTRLRRELSPHLVDVTDE